MRPAIILHHGSGDAASYSDAASVAVDWPVDHRFALVMLDGGAAHIRTGEATDDADASSCLLPGGTHVLLERESEDHTHVHVLGAVGSSGTVSVCGATPTGRL